jgi:hypothetical protein
LAPGEPQGQIVITVLAGIAVEGAIRWRFGISAPLPAFAYLGAVGTGLAVNDAYWLRIPNWVVIPSYPISAALLAVASVFERHGWSDLAHGGVAMAAIVGFYLALAIAFPEGLGLGDPLTELRGCFYLDWGRWLS